MPSVKHWIDAAGVWLVVGACLVSCGLGRYTDPIAAMLDRDRDSRFRRQAMSQAQADLAGDPRWPEALHRIVWGPGYPGWQRRLAIDQLVGHDEPAFLAASASRIATLRDRETLDYLFALAVDRRWSGFTVAAIVSYARPDAAVPDDRRPERRVIEQLNPGQTVQQAVWEVFVGAGRTGAYQRALAWELLVRLVDQKTLLAWLDQAGDVNVLVADVRAVAGEWGIMPRNREQLAWTMYLRAPSRKDNWDRCAAVITGLTPQQRVGLDFRHLPVLLNQPPGVLRMDREALLSEIKPILAGEHYWMPAREGTTDNPPQRLEDWEQRLCWADLVVLRAVAGVLSDRSLIDPLFVQADADHADASSEHGGVLDRRDGELVAQPYRPMVRRHDRVFHPPQEMIEHLYTALTHYHFHAQDHRNLDFAGPGRGDRRLADRMGMNCLVFSFVDRDSLNVDYYQPGGVVIDLGTIRRGASTAQPRSRTPR